MKTQTIHSLYLVDFDSQMAENFNAILFLAGRNLTDSWTVVNAPQADFFILSNKKTTLFDTLPIDRCIFYSSSECKKEPTSLQIDSSGVPRLSSVIETLNNLSLHNVENIQNCDDKKPSNFFNIEKTILKLFNQSQENILCFTLKDGIDTCKVYLHFSEQNYFCDVELNQLDRFLLSQEEWNVHILSEDDLIHVLEQNAFTAKPLSHLIWYTAFTLSQGKLLQGHSAENLVYLTKWPDLTISECRKYVKLAAFMRTHAMSLNAIANETAISIERVYNFYNACYLVGLIEKNTAIHKISQKTIHDYQRVLLAHICEQLKHINKSAVI